MSTPSSTKTIGLLAYDDMQSLDLVGGDNGDNGTETIKLG